MSAELNALLLAAHATDDRARLITLYRQAGEEALARGDEARGCFFLTHAYVFALEAGDPVAGDLHAELRRRGREE